MQTHIDFSNGLPEQIQSPPEWAPVSHTLVTWRRRPGPQPGPQSPPVRTMAAIWALGPELPPSSNKCGRYWGSLRRTLNLFRQSIWEDNVTLHLLEQTIWEHIWKFILEKNRTNATTVILHLFRQVFWEKNWKPQCDFASVRADNLRKHLKIHSGEKSNICDQCNFASVQASIWENI